MATGIVRLMSKRAVPDSPPGHNPAQSWAPWRIGNLPMLDRNGSATGSAFIPSIPANRWLLSRVFTSLNRSKYWWFTTSST